MVVTVVKEKMSEGMCEVIDSSKFGSLEKLLQVTCFAVCFKFESQAKEESGVKRKFVCGMNKKKVECCS